MSWYNDNPENNFIDATQEHTGGGVAGSVSEVTNAEDLVITETTPDAEEETTIGNVLLPAVLNEETGTFDLYIRNVNQGGRIYFTTRGDDEKVKIEDGLLYVYYDYDFFNAPTIPGGWTDIVNYLVTTRQLSNANSTAAAAAGGLAASAKTDAGAAFGLATSAQGLATTAEATASSANTTALIAKGQAETNTSRIFRLESRVSFEAPPTPSPTPSVASSANSSLRDQAFQFGEQAASAAAIGGLAVQTGQRAAQLLSRGQIFLNIISAVIGAGLFGSAISLLGLLLDYTRKQQLDNDLIELLKDMEQNAQNYNSSTQDHLHKTGLQIVSSSNGNFTTAGLYLIELTSETFLNIEISGTPLTAKIDSVLGGKTTLVVNDVITIPKSDLGGSTTGSGNLEITITSLITELNAYDGFLQGKINEAVNIENRQRRRQNIPTSSSFTSDGFNITNTQITEPITSEITNEPTISLKVDTAQFQYDASGNLQIKSSVLAPSIATDPAQFTTDSGTGNLQIIDYDKIAEIGDDTAGAETGLYQYVLDKIDETLGAQETYDADGNVVVPATNVYQEINNIYELVMVGDQTFQNNNDYKLNLGYKTIWSDYTYDLITIALKAVRAGIFDSSFYNNDWLGYFPSLTRISDDDYMSVVKDVNVEILNNLTFKKGLVYFKQDDPLVDYNLNRKFEFVCFIRPQDVDNVGVEYTLLQTGIRLPSTEYDLDAYKLKLGFRDNKFEITHNVRRVVDYYAALTYKNYENSPPVFYPTIFINNQTTGEISRQSIYYGVERYYGILDQQTYIPYVSDWTIMLRRTININFSYAINFGVSFYDMNFNTLKSMANPATDTWASPKIIYKEPLAIQQPRNGVAKIVVAFEYFVAPSQGNTLQLKTFTSVADIDQNLEFKWRINLKKVGDPAIYGSRIYDFDQFQYHSSYNPTSANHLGFYVQTLWLPHQTYPLSATDTYNYIELELVHRGGATFAPLPVGSQSYDFYNGQHSIRLHAVNFFDYDVSPDTFVDHSVVTFQDTADFLPSPLDANKWHKVVAELDLPNKVVQYWVDDVNNYFTFDTTINNIPHSSLQLPNSDPTIPYFYSADFEFTSQGHTTLVSNNDIIVIGNEPSQGELQYTHFAWKHFQDPLEYYMTQAERDKLDILINYNYYYETIKVDRYLKVKEFYADVLDARKILVNGGFAFNELTSGDQITLIRSDFQSSDNVATTNAFVNIDRLYVSDPVASGSGFLSFDANTKIFSIGSSTISSADVENAVGNLIKVTPSTYGLIYNQTDPLDKFIQIDDNYVNNLVNLVIQNELVLTNAFTDATYGDVLIQIKDASAYSPYDLRELDDTNVRYNYKINGNHQYLYRELNQEIQYDPLLGVAYGDIYPVAMYHFQSEIINNARDWLVGIPASDYDFEMLSQGGQVVYGSGPLNMKGWNGIEGGNTIIRTKNAMEIATQSHRSCISFFHKPFGSNIDGTDDHKIVEFLDEYNYPVFYVKLEYVSNTAVYKLVFVNPSDINDETEHTFNNSENEIYFGNENCILIWCDMPYWHMYINGKYHGVAMDHTYDYGTGNIDDCKIQIDLNNFNNRSLLYELKIYQKLLFKTNSSGVLSSTDLTFNNKVVVDVTEMIRIATFVSGGFIIKELSGIQETKARSIETKTRSLDTSRRVGAVETKLPTTGTGTKGFVYSDGVNENYNLENPTDLTAVSTTAIGLDDRKILTFKEIPNGADFDIKILSRSVTSISQRDKLIDFSYLGIPPLTIYDDPHPPYEYTFLLSFIETQMQAQGYFYQFETNNVGVPTTGSAGISFLMYVLGGDVIKYSGANGVWEIYRARDSVYTLIQTLNDGDEFLADNYKYRLDELYFRKNNDPNTQIRIFIYGPYLFADKIDLGQEYNMISALSSQHTEPIKNWNFISASGRKKYNHILTDEAGTIRPLFAPAGEKVITTNGMPADPDTYFKWSWGINYTQIACLMESGDLLLNGDVYVNCPTNAPFELNTGILINRIDNLVSPDRASITGIPALVEQVYYMELTSWDRTNFIAYFTGTDRINTYTNQVVSQFEFYYDDTIEISVSSAVLSDIQTYPYHDVGLATPTYSIGFNANNIVTHKFLKSFGSNPYVDVAFGFNYPLNQLNRITIPINLQDIVDYSNDAFLTTDEYILKYKPHTNTFVWEENIGMALDTGVEETSIPLGSFKAKTATTQISSRRTLASAVPIEKISQKTKYQVFNTEVEVNGNLLLEEVNADIASLFTIYTNENKKDPVSGVDNFKDKASITLVDATKEWIFKREPESEDIAIATTKFIHDTTTLLTLKHNQVECGVELKVGTIKFADNTTLTTSVDLTGLLNDISTTNPSYTEFAKNIKLPNGDIISSVYDDTDVRSVLSSSAGTGLVWNAGTNQFDNSITQYADADVRSVLSSSAGTGLVWNSGTNQFDNSITQYTDTNVRSVLSSSAGTGLVWNSGTNQFDNSITQYADADVRSVLSSSAGTGLSWNATNNQFDNSITQYTDADVDNVLSTSAGTGLVWNSGTNQFDNSITQYTDALARTACFPLTQANTGLPGTSAINLFANTLWYNSVDGYNRLYFVSSAGTFIRAPALTNSVVMTEIGTTSILKCDISGVLSYKDLRIGNGNNTIPSLYLDGANGTTLSSRIIFADSGISIYKYGMAIYYDSYNNKLKISGDDNNDNSLETPPALTIVRSNRYVGILNETPLEPLDVNGNIVASGSIKSTTGFTFPDNTTQTTAVSLPSYLFTPAIWKYQLNTITNVNYSYTGASTNFPSIFSGSGAVLLNLNSPVQVNTTNELKILTAGYYQIHISFRFRNNQGSNAMRASIQNFLTINGVFGIDRVATSYMRNTGTQECACTNQATLVEYFNVNDLIKIGFMRIGNSASNCQLFGSNSTITFQRVA